MSDIIALVKATPGLSQRIVSDLPFCRAEIIHAVNHEMARTMLDVLRRRIPLLVLTRLQRNTIQDVCDLVADILNWDGDRRDREIASVLAADRPHRLTE